MTLTPEQVILGATAALIVGFTKTGIPGVGILVVPIMATAFGGWPSVGLTLPLLIFGDLFAVLWYRRHARWDKLVGLVPWVLSGIAAGTALLFILGQNSGATLILSKLIGVLVLIMLAVHLLRQRWGNRLVPTSSAGLLVTGASAGFATTISNAAGPIMSIYMTSLQLPKEQFMGTTAWYFFIFNLIKFPIYVVLSWVNSQNPLVTRETLMIDLLLLPMIVAGAFLGRWVLPRVPQNVFNFLALSLAGIAAIRLIFS